MKLVPKMLLMIFVALTCGGWGGLPNGANAPRLSVFIVSNCTSFDLNDKIELRVSIENEGLSPIVMYGKLGWGEAGGLVLNILNAKGDVVRPPSLDDDIIIPSTLQDRNYYVTLFGNQFIGISRSERINEIFQGIGEYKIWVEYLSPIPKDLSLIKRSFWSMEQGKISSAPLSLMIKKKGSCNSRGGGIN